MTAGQVLEVLGHDDFHQLGLGLLRLLGHVLQERARVLDQFTGLGQFQRLVVPLLPAAIERLRRARHAVLDRARGLGRVQDPVGGLLGHLRHVAQAVAGIGNRVGGVLDRLVRPSSRMLSRSMRVSEAIR